MKHVKYLTIFIVIFLLFSSIFIQNVLAEDEENPDDGENTDTEWPFPVLNKISKFIAKTFFPVYQFQTDKIKVIPEKIEIGYGETVKVELGLIDMLNEDQTNFTVVEQQPLFLTGRWFEFRAEFPDGSPDGWFVSFDPPLVNVAVGKVVKTNVTISLRNPTGPPIQSGIIKINITDVWSYGNVWWPEGFAHLNPFNDEGIPFSPGKKIFWFFAAVTAGFGKYSGKVLPEYMEFDLNVKVKPHKQAFVEALNIIKLKPNQLISIPINIINAGNYKDEFGFRIKSDFENIKLSEPITISLEPGQSGDTLLGVAVPDYLRDAGTVYPVEIEVYSTENPNVTIASQKIMLETQGLYVGEVSGFLFILFIVIVIALFMFIRRMAIKIPKKEKSFEKKPKPKKQKPKEKRESYFSKLSKKEKVKKEKPKKPEPVKEEPVPEVKKPEEVKPKIDKEAERERRKKEAAILRIKNAQEKQKRRQ